MTGDVGMGRISVMADKSDSNEEDDGEGAECEACLGEGLVTFECENCKGAGHNDAETIECSRCDGAGEYEETCPECRGEGWIMEVGSGDE